MSETVENVSKNFKELRIFKGKVLKHYYEHKKLTDQDYTKEKREVVNIIIKIIKLTLLIKIFKIY